MAHSPQHPRRSHPAPESSRSLLVLPMTALLIASMGVLFLAACSSRVGSQGENAPVSDDQESDGTIAAIELEVETPERSEPIEAGDRERTEYAAGEEFESADPLSPVSVPVPRAPSSGAMRIDAKQSADSSGPSYAAFASPSINGPQSGPWNTERYDSIEEAGFLSATDKPLSTFSIDVDTASYSNVRRFVIDGSRPPEGAVRIEEMVNYFRYSSVAEPGDDPFSVETEIFAAPWSKTHRLARIALASREIPDTKMPPRNLVFLLDVSGSMQGSDRLGLVKRGLTGLVEHLRREDRVAIVVYAGASGIVLPPTRGDQRERILDALGALSAGGSTHGADGIRLAYETARKYFDEEGINRVILATDGDFNVGVTSRSELVRVIEKERESGVFLTVLGFGRGNLNDAGMEELADRGNGHYAYIDSPAEARKVLVNEAGSTLVTIAKDVKIQVEFNPARVAAYRLIGYENRRLADRDFNDDKKDAGEIGAGHHVTALYEIIPVGVDFDSGIDPLKYQKPAEGKGDAMSEGHSSEWLTVKLRYKAPKANTSQLLTTVLTGEPVEIAEASENSRFSAAVALFGMLLRDSEYRGEGDFELAQSLARNALGLDPRGERAEFVRLVALAKELKS